MKGIFIRRALARGLGLNSWMLNMVLCIKVCTSKSSLMRFYYKFQTKMDAENIEGKEKVVMLYANVKSSKAIV